MENDQSRTCPVCHQNDAVQKISTVASTPEEPSSSKFSPFMTYLSYALGIFGVLWLVGFLIFGEVDLNVLLTAGLTIGVFIYFLYLRRRYESACSGLMQDAVPIIAPSAVPFVNVGDCEESGVASSPTNAFAKPKSRIFGFPSVPILIFAGFKSLWMIPFS